MPYDPIISLLGIYPKNMKIQIQKSVCAPMFTAALFTIAKVWKQPVYGHIDKEDMIYIQLNITQPYKGSCHLQHGGT